MKLMCAMWAFEWRFELASVFALFRERSFQKDTIPKPGGLGLGERAPRAGCPAFVRHLSSFCPGFVQLLSSPVLGVEVLMEGGFEHILNSVSAKPGSLAPGALRRYWWTSCEARDSHAGTSRLCSPRSASFRRRRRPLTTLFAHKHESAGTPSASCPARHRTRRRLVRS